MSYFIFDGVLKCGQEYNLDKQETRHLTRSRRLRSGEKFLIQDKIGNRFEAIIVNSNGSLLTFIPNISVDTPPPSSLRIEILQALTKEKAINWIIQKSTELGVNQIDFFYAAFSPVSFQNLKTRNPLNRWNRIALEASKQCGRQFPPAIFLHENLLKALESLTKCSNSWVLTPAIKKTITWGKLNKKNNFKSHQRILIGPEGGLHTEEIDLAISSGMLPIDLGPRILRSETSAIAAVSILQFLYGDLK